MSSRQSRNRRRAHQQKWIFGCGIGLFLLLMFCVGSTLLTSYKRLATETNGTVARGEVSSQEDTEGRAVDDSLEAQPLTAWEVRAELEGSTTVFVDGITRYYYSTLSDAEKITYILIAECVFDMAEEVELPTQASTAIADVWPLVRADFPELFWVETSLTRTITEGAVQRVLFVPTYSLSEEQRAVQEAEIEQTASAYYASLALITNPTDYQKVQAAYEFVVGQVTYYANDNDQTVYGALGQGQAVCAGYARAVQYLLNRVGVVCAYVSGEAASEGEQFSHAWNFVQIEGDYYYLDATWGEDTWGTGVDYSYLCVTAQDLATTHFADASYILPAIEGTAYNYYRVIGAYFESYSADAVQAVMLQQTGQGYYTLRFADEASVQQAMQALITDQAIYQILRNINDPVSGIGYTYKEALNVLTIYPQRD